MPKPRDEDERVTMTHRRRPAARPLLAAALLSLAALGACSTTSLDSPARLGLGLGGEASTETSRFVAEQAHHYPVHGIDVSKYQGTIDWNRVRDAGTAFAFLKATEGGDRVDDRFMENWRAARTAGVPRGAYHFWYHCRDGASQADWFIRNVPNDPLALPPVIDVEWTPFSPTCTARPARDDLVREVLAMSDRLERHYGKRPILYIPIDVHRERLVGALPNHNFWLRAVRDHPKNVYENREFLYWQYTEKGSVDGVAGPVDRNVFAGTREDWVRYLRAQTGG